MIHLAQYFPITDPTLTFFVVLLIILLAPIIMGKLRIPHIIGMVLAGVVVGKYGLNILVRDNSFELFGRVGLYYIMFLAALEMDMESIRKNRNRLLIFALLTFTVPLLLTYFMGIHLLNYGITASLLLGCIMASNTLVAYPIVSRYGLQRKPSVTLSVGSSIISLIFSLIMLAAIVASNKGEGSIGFWLFFVSKFVIYCAGAIFLLPRLTRWFLRRYSDAVMQFIFVLASLFLCAALSAAIGLEGIFGAFLSGLILNRYIPSVSPLKNRLEFIGNAVFIPYFLIGVGMLINVRLLFTGGGILWAVICITLFGTLGKAIAAYAACFGFRMPISSGHMMFGMTSAHAAGAIAMVMVGMNLLGEDGAPLVSAQMLNAVIVMILFTCIISSVITEQSAQRIILRDKELPVEAHRKANDQRILVPVKYPEYAEQLMNMAILMLNRKQTRGLVALNVVYDGEHMHRNMEQGNRLLEQMTQYCAGSDIQIQTQTRIAANIANGIKHAFKEFQATEILIGMHTHKEVSTKFWGEFHQSLFNGLNQQITMARLAQPLNTIRRIQVAVPSRAEFGRTETLSLVNEYIKNRHPQVRADYSNMDHWNELPKLANDVADDHLFVIVTARKGTVSYKNALEYLPDEVQRYFNGKNLVIIFPDQYGDQEVMTYSQSQHTEERSAWESLARWIDKRRKMLSKNK